MKRNYVAVSYGALVIIESIWWFSLIAMIGGMLGLGGSPLPWSSLVALMGVGVVTAWLFGGAKGDSTTMAMYQAVVALIAVYLALATATVTDSWSFKIAWPIDTFGGTYGGEGVADVLIGVIAASWLWYRSQNILASGGIARRLSTAFKLGTAFIAFGLLIEMSAIRSDIGIASLLFPFFGSALIGMAASRLPQSGDTGQASWPAVIAISVGGILGIGVVGALLTGRYGNLGVRGAFNVWAAFIDALLWILRYPIEWIMTALFNAILWLQSLVNDEEEPIERDAPGQFSEELENPALERVESASDFAVEALRWPLSILLLVVLFFVLVFAYKRYTSRSSSEDEDERESIRGDADARADMMKLLSSLVPSWMRGGNNRSLWKWPEGDSGISEAFLLYFDTLTHAIKRGMVFDPNVTPNERVQALAVFLPGAPIGAVTARFNAACYGAEPSDLAEIEGLREKIEEAAKKPRPGGED
ncbi:MAG: hypothetical protein HOK43_06080 [Chloroflexi bacterium]|jgi:hypothetical protein|nr:hypothetical protein [Chloroflexota bacterium]